MEDKNMADASDDEKQRKLERLLKANEIIYGQLGYADVKLSFVLAANIGLIVGSCGGIVECCFQMANCDTGCAKPLVPWQGLCIIASVLLFVLIANIASIIFTIQGLSPNTKTHGSKGQKKTDDDAESTIPNNQFSYLDIDKYHVDAHKGEAKTILSLRKEYLEDIDSRGIDGAIDDAAGQNIAVANIITEKYARIKWSVYFLLGSVFPVWFFVGRPWRGHKKKERL
jgi:hypothetical protein